MQNIVVKNERKNAKQCCKLTMIFAVTIKLYNLRKKLQLSFTK